MKQWVTEIKAIDPNTGEMATFEGPFVPGVTAGDAEWYCQNNGLGYCKVVGELVAVIPTKKDGITPDWDKQLDYDNIDLN